mmetsp:Transcript_69678/g.130021  ORF Transcript_69678/g.130021 Transcript_69678/m.130021 type:complete len:517 (-) Transcript_69678:37-1587(-)
MARHVVFKLEPDEKEVRQPSQPCGLSSGCCLCFSWLRQLRPPKKGDRKEKRLEPQVVRAVPSGNKAAKKILNGFQTLPEAAYVSVQAENVAPFSLPQEALTYTPLKEDAVVRYSGGDKERMVTCNTPLEADELRDLALLQQEAAHRQVSFLPSLTIAATRFTGDARGDIDLALKNMQASQEWKLDYFKDGPITDASVMEELRHGVVYFTGRDRALRPALVCRPARVPPSHAHDAGARLYGKAVVFLMEYFLRYMHVPGRVENVVVILDLKDYRVRQLPFSALTQLIKVLSQQHAGRVFRFYICNNILPAFLQSLVLKTMTERQKMKCVFVSETAQLLKEFALPQLEESLGGSRPKDEVFWPCPMPAGPFHAGYDGEPDPDAIKNLHEVLSAQGRRGRLWDEGRSEEENTRLDFATSRQAKELLQTCGINAPEEAAVEEEHDEIVEEFHKMDGTMTVKGDKGLELHKLRKPFQLEIEADDDAFTMAGLFSCRPCHICVAQTNSNCSPEKYEGAEVGG